MHTGFDAATGGQAWAGPGMDTRQWVSYGTVDRQTPDVPNVAFTTEYGPLVRVTLHPSATPVVCRVAHEVAGNGEGEWFPFLEGDEVIVLIPEGDESAGCVIVGRLNQEIDAWPRQVAGQDATQNKFAFRRLRTPYVLETAGGYLIRSAKTGAFLGISAEGAVTISNADKAFLALSADFIGLQSGDASTLMQIDVTNRQVVLEAAGTKMTVDEKASSFYTTGTLQLGTAGNQAAEHATSIEAVVVLLNAFGAFLATQPPAPLTTATLGAFLEAPAFDAVITAASSLGLSPTTVTVLKAALAVPKIAGVKPGVGCPGLLIG